MAEPLQKTALFKKLHIALFVFVILIAKSSNAQSLLLPGDIVFVSVNANSNTFEFVPLIDLEEGTEFHVSNGIWDEKERAFTDNQTVVFTSIVNISAGTPIKFDNNSAINFNSTGEIELSDKSEQLFLFQKDTDRNRFIYAIGWGEKPGRRDRSFFGSDIPGVLKDTPKAVLSLGNNSNYQYFIRNGASGTPKMLLGFISNAAFWRGNDEQGFPAMGTSFNLLKPPVILFDESLSTIKEDGENTTLNVAIYEHDGSKLTVDVAFDSAYSSIERSEIKGFRSQQINFTGLIGDAVYEVEIPVQDDKEYEGIEAGIFSLQNLSKGSYGDFITHTVLVLDDEIPEIKLELSNRFGQDVLMVHNVESKEIDLGNWELTKGDMSFNFRRNTFLGVGESIILVTEENNLPASMSSAMYRLDKDFARILKPQGTIELRNSEGTKIAEVTAQKKEERKSTLVSESQSTATPETKLTSTGSDISIVNSKVVTPGWKTTSTTEIDVNEFPNTDFYYWKESDSRFFKVGESDANLSKSEVIIGYFDEPSVKKFDTKRKESLKSNPERVLTATISATDSDENGRIQGIEGLNLIRNNTDESVFVEELRALIKSKLELDEVIEIFHSTPNFTNISLLSKTDIILPQETFWIKFNSELKPQDLELNLEEVGAFKVEESDTEKGILELEVSGLSKSNSIQINFISDETPAIYKKNLKLNKELYLNNFNDVVLSTSVSDEFYDAFEISNAVKNITQLPLSFAAYKSGEFELKVKKWTDIPDGWVIKIEDLKEEKFYDLTENWSIKFNYSDLGNEESGEIRFPSIEERFVLKVIPEDLVDSEKNDELPTTVELRQNYPNPFNPTTTISFYMPEEGNVKLSVFNIVGQPVAVLLQETRSQGEHTLEWDASDMPSGIYIYQLEVGTKIMTRKMTLVK